MLNGIVVGIIGLITGVAKVIYAFSYSSSVLFNLFDVFVFGSAGFLIGLIVSRLDERILAMFLSLPSLIIVSETIYKVYISHSSTYPSYEWIFSLILIPISSYVGILMGRRLKQKRHIA